MKTIDVLEVNCWKMEDGLIAVPVDAQVEGHDRNVTLRFDIEAAESMIGRLRAGVITASNARK
jgi:hypothetical protein